MPELDAHTMNTVGIQSITLQHEGWERDKSVPEPDGDLMLLPGGLLRHGELRRRVRLRELDGFLELLIGERHGGTGRSMTA